MESADDDNGWLEGGDDSSGPGATKGLEVNKSASAFR